MKRSEGEAVSVDERGFVRVDGITIGKRVVKDGKPRLQVCDKDRRRSAERGTRFVEVTVEELGEVLDEGSPPLVGIAGIEEGENGTP
jgi:hypothetical protein